MRPRSLCRWLVKNNWRISLFYIIIFSIQWQRRLQLLPFLIYVQQQHELAHSFFTDETIYSMAIAGRAMKRKMYECELNPNGFCWCSFEWNWIEIESWVLFLILLLDAFWWWHLDIVYYARNKWSHQLRPSSTWWMPFNLSVCGSLNVMSRRERNCCHQFWLESVSYKFVSFWM